MSHAEPLPTNEDRFMTTGDHAVLVTSIGAAGAAIVTALKHASNMPEQILACRLFQAPSILFGNLTEPLAADVARVLCGAGVECEVVPKGHRFTQGDSEHEVALVIRDVTRMQGVLEGVMALLGVGVREAKDIVCATPAVLMGRVSAATVSAIRRRFEPLGVEVDVSRPSEARFDAFLGDGSSMLATDLSRADAESLHGTAARGRQSIVILNRDFQRFDVCLEAAPNSTEMASLLVETAQIPERIVQKVLARLPIVTHSGVRRAAMGELLAKIEALGGRASGRLISFQRFGLVLDAVKDASVTERLLCDLGGLTKADVDAALGRAREPVGALSGTLARWLQRELELQGTKSRMVLR